MAFGKQLKDILEEKGMSVTSFSRISGIPRNTLYSYIRRDTEKPNIDVYIALHQIGVDVDKLLGNITNESERDYSDNILPYDPDDPDIKVLCELTPEEFKRVSDFARGLIAARRRQ